MSVNGYAQIKPKIPGTLFLFCRTPFIQSSSSYMCHTLITVCDSDSQAWTVPLVIKGRSISRCHAICFDGSYFSSLLQNYMTLLQCVILKINLELMNDIYHLIEQIHFKCQKAQPMLSKAKKEIIDSHSRCYVKVSFDPGA